VILGVGPETGPQASGTINPSQRPAKQATGDDSISLGVLALFLLRGGYHKSLPIYALLLILMPLSTGSMMSMLRCEVVAFPAFFALAGFGKTREVDRLIIYGSATFLSLFKLASSNGYFLG